MSSNKARKIQAVLAAVADWSEDELDQLERQLKRMTLSELDDCIEHYEIEAHGVVHE